MADAVSTIVQSNNPNRYVARFTNRSDGTGESDVVKVDKSTLIGLFGIEPASLSLEWVQWSIQGFTSVQFEWDHTTDDVMAILAEGNGFKDYRDAGLKDPLSAGGTGDVLLTTFGAAANATYDIEMSFKKRGSI